ncbi:hypothetical protein EBR77_03015 [bacterium]|nr:hypothetical protein [bacterium]
MNKIVWILSVLCIQVLQAGDQETIERWDAWCVKKACEIKGFSLADDRQVHAQIVRDLRERRELERYCALQRFREEQSRKRIRNLE